MKNTPEKLRNHPHNSAVDNTQSTGNEKRQGTADVKWRFHLPRMKPPPAPVTGSSYTARYIIFYIIPIMLFCV